MLCWSVLCDPSSLSFIHRLLPKAVASGGPPDISYSGQDQDNSGHELSPAYLLQNIPMSSQARMQMLVGEEFVCVCVCVCFLA